MKVNNLLTTTTTYLFIVVLIIFTTTSTCAEKKKKNSKTQLVLDIEDYIQITDWFSRYASTVDHKQWELFPDLFTKQEFEPFNPNPLELGGKILNNSTRVQLLDACNSGPRNN